MNSTPSGRPIQRLLTGSLALIALWTSGCISKRYQAAPKDTPSALVLNIPLGREPIESGLVSLITYNGPGSWKKDAFWDEYVLALHNPGKESVTLSGPVITDLIGSLRSPGDNPWPLEKASQSLERHYKNLGIAFVRYTAPVVVILGAGTAAVISAGIFSAAAESAAFLTVAAIPVYYISVVAINISKRHAIEKEFNRRRLVFPLVLAPGESRTGSLFFPMIASPRSLDMDWQGPADRGRITLSLDCLRQLHLKNPLPAESAPVPAP